MTSLTPMRWPQNIKRKLAISFISLTAAVVLGEVITRAIEPGPFSFWDTNPYLHYEDGRAHRHRAGFSGRWDGTWYETNTLGLRGPELNLSMAENELRVVCLGDSCTFGKGVVEEHTWPRQLERQLAAELGPNRRAVVANLGVNGYSGETYRDIFADLGDQVRPGLVIVGYNLNDFPNAIQAVDAQVFQERGLRKFFSRDLRDRLGRLGLYRFMRQGYYQYKRESDWQRIEALARRSADQDLDSDVWREQEEHLIAIRDQAAGYGAKTVVFLFPYESQVYLDTYDTTPIERLKEIGARLQLPVVDLAEAFRLHANEEDPPRELFLKGDRYHPNPEGYHLVARRVIEELTRERLLSAE